MHAVTTRSGAEARRERRSEAREVGRSRHKPHAFFAAARLLERFVSFFLRCSSASAPRTRWRARPFGTLRSRVAAASRRGAAQRSRLRSAIQALRSRECRRRGRRQALLMSRIAQQRLPCRPCRRRRTSRGAACRHRLDARSRLWGAPLTSRPRAVGRMRDGELAAMATTSQWPCASTSTHADAGPAGMARSCARSHCRSRGHTLRTLDGATLSAGWLRLSLGCAQAPYDEAVPSWSASSAWSSVRGTTSSDDLPALPGASYEPVLKARFCCARRQRPRMHPCTEAHSRRRATPPGRHGPRSCRRACPRGRHGCRRPPTAG
jgi:hypothetical protein